MISNIKVGDQDARSKDVIGRAYEYFLSQFASAEGKKGGRYVGVEAHEDDGEPFPVKMARLTAQWREQQAEAANLDAAIEANLEALGFLDAREPK